MPNSPINELSWLLTYLFVPCLPFSTLLRNARPRESVYSAGFLVGLTSRKYWCGQTQG